MYFVEQQEMRALNSVTIWVHIVLLCILRLPKEKDNFTMITSGKQRSNIRLKNVAADRKM